MIAKALQQAIREGRLTQRELARASGVDEVMISLPDTKLVALALDSPNLGDVFHPLAKQRGTH
jgi:hypothetical protein